MSYRKFNRNTSNRKAMFRSVLTAFFKNERIETTETKAKEISGLADKMITLAKKGDLSARRQVLAFLVDEDATKKLFDVIAPKYADRNGGYTRIYTLTATAVIPVFTKRLPAAAMQLKWLSWN